MFQFAAALKSYGVEFLIILLILPIIGLLGVLIAWQSSIMFNPEKLAKRVRGKHCLVTGGSLGLGSKIAEQLVKAGAHVTIVARGKRDHSGTSSLERKFEELKKISVNDTQIIDYIPCDLSNYEKVVQMVQELHQKGQLPDFLVCNAGSSVAGFLSNQIPKSKSKSEFEQGNHEWMISQNYYSAVFVIRALMQITRVEDKDPRTASISGISPPQAALLPKQIVLVGSVLSLLSFIGYSAYSASKYALVGFADALRSELAPLGIKVSIYFPGNMDTPGIEQENMLKPDITKEIEGASALCSAENAAKSLLAGVLNDKYYISNDILGELARVSVHGGAPRSNMLFEVLATPLLAIIFTVWTSLSDKDIKSYFEKQNKTK